MPRQAIQALLILTLAALPAFASAAPLQWNGSLSQAQVEARARESFDAQLAELSAATAEAQSRSARAVTQPQISVSATTMHSTLVQLGMPAARQTYGSLNATVPLFTPTAWSAARAATLDASAARADAAMGVNQAVARAVQQYDATALAEAIAEQRAIAVRDQQAHLTRTQQRVRAGADPRYLIARDEAALARAQQAQEDAKANEVRARHALEVLLDLDTNSQPIITLSAPSLTFAPDAAALERRAYAQRPDVVAAERKRTAALKRMTSARSEYLPMISATAQTYNGVSNPALGGSGFQIGVSASLPLVDGGSRSADLQLAHVAYERARIELNQTRLQAQAEVLDAVRDLQAAQRNILTANAELASAQIELHITQLRERSGKGIELETLDALATVANAREDLLRATARYNDSLAALHGAVGDYAPRTY